MRQDLGYKEDEVRRWECDRLLTVMAYMKDKQKRVKQLMNEK
jgi:hypothetical protein